METNEYQIVLERGKALKPFYELNEVERQKIGKKIFLYVTDLAAKFGSEPIILKSSLSTKK